LAALAAIYLLRPLAAGEKARPARRMQPKDSMETRMGAAAGY